MFKNKHLITGQQAHLEDVSKKILGKNFGLKNIIFSR